MILRHFEGTLVHSKAGLLGDESEGSNTLNDTIHGLVPGSSVTGIWRFPSSDASLLHKNNWIQGAGEVELVSGRVLASIQIFCVVVCLRCQQDGEKPARWRFSVSLGHCDHWFRQREGPQDTAGTAMFPS